MQKRTKMHFQFRNSYKKGKHEKKEITCLWNVFMKKDKNAKKGE